MISITLLPQETTALLSWYEYANEESFHYGGSTLLIPADAKVVHKLKETTNDMVELQDAEIETAAEWMEKTLCRKYGSAIYALPFEKTLHEKISIAIKKIIGIRRGEFIIQE